MEQSTSLFSQKPKEPLQYEIRRQCSVAISLAAMRELEKYPWYQESSKSDADRLACVAILMRIWSRNFTTHPRACELAKVILHDLGFSFNHKPTYEKLANYGSALLSLEALNDYSKFTLITQDYLKDAECLMNKLARELDQV